MAQVARYNILSGDSDRKFGPYTLEEIASMLASGEVSLQTWCICVGDGEMVSVAELFPGRTADPPEEMPPVDMRRKSDDAFDEDESQEDYEDYEEDEEEDPLEEVPWEDGVWYAEEEENAEDDEEVYDEGAPTIDMDEVIVALHPSIFGYPGLLLGAFFFFIVAMGTLVLSGVFHYTEFLKLVGWGAGLASVLSVVLILIIRSFDNYYVTRSRAEIVQGIIAKSSKEVRISDVRRIDVDKRGLLGLLNVGDVKLSSAGTGGFDVVFKYVRGAHRIKKIIRSVQKNPHSSKRQLLSGGRLWRR